MLFNSYIYIFFFLPIAFLAYHGLKRFGAKRSSILALTLLSLCFYGWWNPVYLLLLVPLVLANYACATIIIAWRRAKPWAAKALLVAGIAGNLAVLGYFKYANFLVNNLDALFGINLFLAQIVLPLGISFFTFQKIAFLADAWRGKVERLDLLDFSLFVSFFPQLIAGPIVHHSEVLPQFRRDSASLPKDIILGLTIFTFGLAKKVLLADAAAQLSSPVFDAAARGVAPHALEAWGAAVAYAVQLYFDFSGYSDMAIGAALLFGIRLPVNFNSPYKAANIIDFWRRWHITLSRFLRDYLYIPLGGNRCGAMRRHINIGLVMLLGGLWHGANWTFVVWGGLHGAYLIVNHIWQSLRPVLLRQPPGRAEALLGFGLTFGAVVVAWVFFRAADVNAALVMLTAMTQGNAASLTSVNAEYALPVGMLLVAWFAPNTQEITGYFGPEGKYGEGQKPRPVRLRWKPDMRWAIITGFLFAASVMSLSHVSEFIYFQF